MMNKVKAKWIQHISENENLELIIIPTWACNFKCIYCYEEHSKVKMKKRSYRRNKEFNKKGI